MGVFTEVVIKDDFLNEMRIVYSEFYGNVYKVGRSYKKFNDELKNDFKNYRCFGIFYDDPDRVLFITIIYFYIIKKKLVNPN